MFKKVENKKRKNAASKYYYHIRDLEGVDYLFSESQLKAAQVRANANPEDVSHYEIEEAEGPFWKGVVAGFFAGAISCVLGYAIGNWIMYEGIWVK